MRQNRSDSEIGWPNGLMHLPRIRLLSTRPRHLHIRPRLLELSHTSMYATCPQQTLTRPFGMGQPFTNRNLTACKILLCCPLSRAHLRPSNTNRTPKSTLPKKPARTASPTKDRNRIAWHAPLARRGRDTPKRNRTRHNTHDLGPNSIGNRALDNGMSKYLMLRTNRIKSDINKKQTRQIRWILSLHWAVSFSYTWWP